MTHFLLNDYFSAEADHKKQHAISIHGMYYIFMVQQYFSAFTHSASDFELNFAIFIIHT